MKLTLDSQIHIPGLVSPTRTPWTGPLREVIYDQQAFYRWDTVAERHGLDADSEDFDLADHASILTLEDIRDLADDPNAEILTDERMSPEAFKQARKTLGLTGEELSYRLAVRADTLRRWESGRDSIPYGVPADLVDVAENRIDEISTLVKDLRP